MWNFILGYLFADATGISRIIRPLLVLVLFGVLIAGIVYAAVIVHAVAERSHATDVLPLTSH
jgi:hypothetical protein